MHTLRHTAAMRLLLAGNDITVIALWLGHEQISTTNIYLHADMTHKQKAIDRTKPSLQNPAATAHRHAPRLPRSALIMPTSRPRNRSEQPLLNNVGITRTSAYSWLCRRRHNHDLRHTFGTRMIAKADIRRVQEWMGHADIQTTMKYLHYAPREQDAELVAQAFESTPSDAVRHRIDPA